MEEEKRSEVEGEEEQMKSGGGEVEGEEKQTREGDVETKDGKEERAKEAVSGRRSKRDRKARRKTNSGTDEQVESSQPVTGTRAEAGSSPKTEYRREDSILALGGKPKVVVPSPKGIPKPIPIRLSRNRDSMISQDSFDEEPGPGAVLTITSTETDTRRETAEEQLFQSIGDQMVDTEEFQAAVDSFDQLLAEVSLVRQRSRTVDRGRNARQSVNLRLRTLGKLVLRTAQTGRGRKEAGRREIKIVEDRGKRVKKSSTTNSTNILNVLKSTKRSLKRQ